MGESYCTKDDLQAQGFEGLSDDDSALEQLCEAASRIFDRAAEVPSGYFKAAAGDATATERIFYGDGTDMLRLPPYKADSITEVTLPADFAEVEYVEQDGALMLAYTGVSAALSLMDPTFWPARNDWQSRVRMGWPLGVAIHVTAVWGFEAVPADVKQATIQIAIAAFRDVDPASVRASDIEAAARRVDALPPMARGVADYWKSRAVLFA